MAQLVGRPQPGLVPSSSGQRLRMLDQNADFAVACEESGRRRFTASRLEMQRSSNNAWLGVDVPPNLEDLWKALKTKQLANGEVVEMLGLKLRRSCKAKRRAGKGA